MVYVRPAPSSRGTNLIAIADVNGDGLNDLVITDSYPYGSSSAAVEVMLQSASSPGTFLPAASYPVASGSFPQSIALADVNGDGLADVIVGGSNAVSVLLQTGAALELSARHPTMPWSTRIRSQSRTSMPTDDGYVIATGVNHPIQSGIAVNPPGVLLQSATTSGTFLAVSDLP